MAGRIQKWCRPAALIALALAAGACARRQPLSGRLPPPPPKPRFTASASALTHTNEWKPVALPPRESPAPAVTNLPPVAPPAPAPAPAPTPSLPTPPPATNRIAAALPATGTGAVLAANSGPAYRLRPGDPVVISLRGILPREEQFEGMVDEQGLVKLPYLERVQASGRTTSQLEDEIERLYIEGKIYKSVSVSVIMPSQSYFIQGEVKDPGRVPLITGVTLLQALAQAGGYTDYADETDVRIIRAGKTSRYNARDLSRYPERDVRIEPGDVINVERKFF